MIDFMKVLSDAGNAIGDAVSNAANEAGKLASNVANEAGKNAINAANGAGKIINDLGKKIEIENRNAQLRKYNPVFLNDYRSASFGLPNVIVIVDDAVRKDIKVCKGAIGWKSNPNNVEIFHLYDEFVNDSGLHFIPAPVCDTVYYVDPHDRTHFISFECLFRNIQEQMIGELCGIAHSLGAKYYSIELEESEEKDFNYRQNMNLGKNTDKFAANVEFNKAVNSQKKSYRKALASGTFEGYKHPERPSLCWFKYHNYINEIINEICQKGRKINKVNAVFNGEDYSIMSRSMAKKVDAAIFKLGLGHNYNIDTNVKKSVTNKMILHMEF